MAFSQYLKYRALIVGYEWRLRIKISASGVGPFAELDKFFVHIRENVDGPILASLSSDDSTVVRVDENSLEIIVAGAVSEGWTFDSVVMDVVKERAGQFEHLGFEMHVPVKRPVTRVSNV